MPENEGFEGEEEEGEETETTPSHYLTAAQVQEMMDRQAEMFTQGLQQTVERYVPQARPQEPVEEPIQAPSHEQLRLAAEEGDWTKYTALQEQREQAVYQASMREVDRRARAMRQEGGAWMAETNRRFVDTKVPDYKKYQKDVDLLAEQLGIDPVSRTDPNVVELLTSTIRGRPENMEKEFAARIEAQKRQANGDGTTSDVASPGRSFGGQHSEQEPVFSHEALRGMDDMGKDRNALAKRMGYNDWAAYETAAAGIYSADKAVPKWRRGKGGR